MNRILLTDSDAEHAQSVRNALMEHGFDVVVAAGATEAREMFDFVRPEIVLVDDELEDGSGAELCRELKTTPQGRQCTFVLGSDELSDQVDACVARPLCAADFITWCEQRLPKTLDEVDEMDAIGEIDGPPAAEDATTGPVEPVSADADDAGTGSPMMMEKMTRDKPYDRRADDTTTDEPTHDVAEAGQPTAEESPDESVSEEPQTEEVPVTVACEVVTDLAAEEILEEAVAEVVAEAGATVRMDPAAIASAIEASAGKDDTGEDISNHLDSLFAGDSKATQAIPVKLSPPVEIRKTDIDLPERRSQFSDAQASPPEQAAQPPAPIPATTPVADLPSREPAHPPAAVTAPRPRETTPAGFPWSMIGVATAGLALAIAGWIFFGGDRSTSPAGNVAPTPAAPVADRPSGDVNLSPAGPVASNPPANAKPAPPDSTGNVVASDRPGPPAATQASATNAVATPSVTTRPSTAVTEGPIAAGEPTPPAPTAAAPSDSTAKPVVSTNAPAKTVAAVAVVAAETAADAPAPKPATPRPRFTVEPQPVATPEPAGSSGFTGPVLVDRPAPGFGRSLLDGAQGGLVLSLMVGPDGRVTRVIVDRTTVGPELENAAVDAVLEWRYRAAVQDGEAVSAWATARFEF